jgi:BirA family biotin operon repressor/biotin-[acetyl-CoA-carboxylase] ligase
VTTNATFAAGAHRLAAAARTQVDNVIVFGRIDSTQACALRLIEQAEVEEITLPPTVVIAVEQESGRGRLDRSWLSPAGGLYLSWLSAGLDRDTTARLPMIVAAAGAEAINRLGIENVGIKWPNDLMIDGEKCAGCLIHARHGATGWAVVGFGVNVDGTPDLAGETERSATSLAAHLPGEPDPERLEALTRVFIEELTAGLAAPDRSLERWRARLRHRPGDEIIVRLSESASIRGRLVGLTDDGHLRLEVDGAERTISSGDVIE